MTVPADRPSAHELFGELGLTYDDVLLQPNESDVIPSEADTATLLGSLSRGGTQDCLDNAPTTTLFEDLYFDDTRETAHNDVSC